MPHTFNTPLLGMAAHRRCQVGSTQWGNSFGGGQQESKTGNTSRTVNSNYSDANASARGRSGSDARGEGESEQEQWQRRPIFLPEEIGRFFSGQDEFTRNESWPGLALVLVGGARTMVVRRVLYFEDPLFAGLYNHHRKHLPELAPVLALPAPGRDFEWGSKPGSVTPGPMMKAEDIVGFWKGIGLIVGALVVVVLVIALLVKGVMMLFSH